MHFPKIKLGVYDWHSVDYSFTKDGQKIVKGSEKIKFNITSQNNEFLFGSVLDSYKNNIGPQAIGVIKKNINSYDIYITTNIPDSRTFIITPTHYSCGKVDAFTGIMIEPNYSSTIFSSGTPTVASLTMKWIHK